MKTKDVFYHVYYCSSYFVKLRDFFLLLYMHDDKILIKCFISQEVFFVNLVNGQCQDFLLQVFFHESFSHKPLKITLGSFQICCKQGTPPDTGDKFATSVNDTVGKFGHRWCQ